MTLEDAIRHAEEIAKEKEEQVKGGKSAKIAKLLNGQNYTLILLKKS